MMSSTREKTKTRDTQDSDGKNRGQNTNDSQEELQGLNRCNREKGRSTKMILNGYLGNRMNKMGLESQETKEKQNKRYFVHPNECFQEVSSRDPMCRKLPRETKKPSSTPKTEVLRGRQRKREEFKWKVTFQNQRITRREG